MSIKRAIVVDDTSPLIQYGDSWFLDATGSQDALGNYGPVFNKTLHGTVTNSTFTFSYSGTSIDVMGTNNLRNDTGTPDPQWECTVDGTLLPNNPYRFPENNWSLCSTSSTPLESQDGPHTLTVKVTVRQNQTFWLDKLLYTPSSSVPLDDKAIFVDNNDPELQYGPGWGAWGGGANATSQSGSMFSFSFIGTSISWFGYIATESPHVATSATFSLDGNTPTSFMINALSTNNGVPTLYNQRLFSTPIFSPGPHKLDVAFLGNGKTTSLILDYLVVQNGTVAAVQSLTGAGGTQPPAQISKTSQASQASQTPQKIPPNGVSNNSTVPFGGSSASQTPIPTSISGKSSSHNIPEGPIVGGVLGALVIFFGGLLACYAYRLRNRRRVILSTKPRTPTAAYSTTSGHRPRNSLGHAGVASNIASPFIPTDKLTRCEPCSPTPPRYLPTDLQSVNSTSPFSHQVAQFPSPDSQGISLEGVDVHQDSGMQNVLAPELPLRAPEAEAPPRYTETG